MLLGYKTEGGGVGFDIAGSPQVEILGGVHTNHGRPLWHSAAYPYIQPHGAQVAIITRFMQSDKTYESYIRDRREGKTRVFPSSEFPALGTDNPVERIVPLYIGYNQD